jgi:hypothetical protein
MSDQQPPSTSSGSSFLSGDELRKISESWSVHDGTSQDIIKTTDDKVRLCLIQYRGIIRARADWIAPFSTLLTFVATLVAAEFKDFLGAPAEFWQSSFFVSGLATGVWLVVAICRVVRAHGKSDPELYIEALRRGSSQMNSIKAKRNPWWPRMRRRLTKSEQLETGD